MEALKISKQYDLEKRCLLFAKNVRAFVKSLPRSISNTEDGKQLIRSSGSVGANYIEANESLSQKDLILRIRIARKEAKESKFWLEVIDIEESNVLGATKLILTQEANELMLILSSIMRKLIN